MHSGRNWSARERASFVCTHAYAVERSSRDEKGEPAGRRGAAERPRWGEGEGEGWSGERVTEHVIGSTRCSRDRPRDVTRTCRIAW